MTEDRAEAIAEWFMLWIIAHVLSLVSLMDPSCPWWVTAFLPEICVAAIVSIFGLPMLAASVLYGLLCGWGD